MKTIILLLLIFSTIYATKINDVANIVGVRDNQIILTSYTKPQQTQETRGLRFYLGTTLYRV